MQGVTVIKSFSKAYVVCGIAFVVLAAVALSAGVFLAIVAESERRDGEKGAAAALVLLVVCMVAHVVVGIYGAVAALTPVEYKRVKVDPSANYWEFTQKYEIDSQEGDDYIVKERDETK